MPSWLVGDARHWGAYIFQRDLLRSALAWLNLFAQLIKVVGDLNQRTSSKEEQDVAKDLRCLFALIGSQKTSLGLATQAYLLTEEASARHFIGEPGGEYE